MPASSKVGRAILPAAAFQAAGPAGKPVRGQDWPPYERTIDMNRTHLTRRHVLLAGSAAPALMAQSPKSAHDIAALLHRMEGISVALASPLDARGDLDVSGLEKLIEHVIKGGVSCLFPLGWCGEGTLLPDATRATMMRETCRIN